MRLRLVCAFLVLNCSAAMWGQATGPTSWDVFVGGLYNRGISESTGQDQTVHLNGQNLYGWDVSVSERPYASRRWIGGTIEAGGTYYSNTTIFENVPLAFNYSLYTVMGGPVVAVPSGRVRPFAHALLGAGIEQGSDSAEGQSASGSVDHFGFALGGGVDVSINRKLAIRGQGDWLRVSQTQVDAALSMVRATAGIVVRF
jgi:hypothetical protein